MSPSVLQRIASGDSAAVRECIDQYGPLVWSIARRLSRTPPDAEDANQGILLGIRRGARRLRIDQPSNSIAEPPMDPCGVLDTLLWAEPGSASETSTEAQQAARTLA